MKFSQEWRDESLSSLKTALSLVEKELYTIENDRETLRHKRNTLKAAIAIVSENPGASRN